MKLNMHSNFKKYKQWLIWPYFKAKICMKVFHVLDTLADDGEAHDAVVLGPTLSLGSTANVVGRARIDFIDAGRSDPKWVCADAPLSRFERLQVAGFFRCYAVAKGLINRARGKRGRTRYLGWL